MYILEIKEEASQRCMTASQASGNASVSPQRLICPGNMARKPPFYHKKLEHHVILEIHWARNIKKSDFKVSYAISIAQFGFKEWSWLIGGFNPTNMSHLNQLSQVWSIYHHISIVEKRDQFWNLHPVKSDLGMFWFRVSIRWKTSFLCSWASLRMARQPWPAICGMLSDISYVYFMMFELKMYCIYIYIYILLYDILCVYIYIYTSYTMYILDILLSTPGKKLIIDMNIPLSNHFTIHPPGDNNHAFHGQC